MYWSTQVWATYDPSWCYGHDEPTTSYISTAAGSGGDANFRVTLPADGATYTQGDFYATIWFGGTVYDVDSLDQQAFLEFQIYPAPPASTGSGSGATDCGSDGSFDYVYTAGSNEWFACAIVWQIAGGVEDAAFAGPLDSGSSTAILEMHSGDVLWVNYSGVAKSSSQGWHISVNDTTAGTGGSVTLVNGGLILSPYYSTAATGNGLLWGASDPGAIAFAYEIGHSLNPAIPEGGSYGACYPGDGACDSYWPGEWAQAGQIDLELPVVGQAGSQTYPSQLKFSSSQGGEYWINSSTDSESFCAGPSSSTSTNCLYSWYQYRSASYGFTFDTSNVTNATYNYGSWYQFPSTQNGQGQWNGRVVTAPWGTLKTTVSPLSATVDFNRLGQTLRLTVAPNGTTGGQFEEGPYWLNVSAPGCTGLSTFVYMRTSAFDNLSSQLSCNGNGPLTATANGAPISGDAPLTVDFTGSGSGGTPTYTYNWRFGDGTSSTSQNPSHLYASTGQYTVVFNVTDSKGDTAASSLRITVAGSVSAGASANVTSGPVNLSVQFTGSASGGTPAYSWAWKFGDGQTSSSQNPTHVYRTVSTFTAQLNVTDSKGAYALSSVTIHTSLQSHYTVWFNESRLPTGTNWTVFVNSTLAWTTGASLPISLLNGSYPYVVGVTNTSFHPVSANGHLSVMGANVAVAVPFVLTNYTLTFRQTTLPSGLSWSVDLGGTASSTSAGSLSYQRSNGTYPYGVTAPSGYGATPSSGRASVSGANLTITVNFALLTFRVAFEQQGLPSGSNWTVTFAGNPQTSTARWNNFSAADGIYSFSATPPTEYTVTPRSGSVTVDLANQTVPLTFAPILYTVTFDERGLPNGSAWSLHVGGLYFNGSSSSVQVDLFNGTYNYSTSVPTGYSSLHGTGSIRVAGEPLTVSMTFAKASSSPNFFTSSTFYLAVAAVAALTAGTVIYLVGARRRRTPPGPT
ncbi:MAG TPA: PKD domain-containing protein [Thermoplasmata archaeon]|nr:PKD domain-containing protein [Thermoplasmata archaeon]